MQIKTSQQEIQIREKVVKIKYDIPLEFLIKCQKGKKLKNNSLESVADVAIDHKEKADECRLRHNSLIDYWMSIE